MSMIKYDFGQNINDKIATHVLYNNDSNDYIIPFNKYSYAVLKYLDETSEIVKLRIGSIIRIGKVKLKVTFLKISNNDEQIKEEPIIASFQEIKKENIIEETLHVNEQKTCRICFQQNDSLDNPLVSICECKGSLEFIHLSCLSNWVNSRTEKITKLNNSKDLNSYYVILKNYYCELCHNPYPIYIKIRNKDYFLLKFLYTINDVIILAEYNKESKKNWKNEIKFYVFEFNSMKKQYIIGRSRSSDLRFDHISLSRNHCMIYYKEGCFKIRDLNSKFGTLIKLTRDIWISANGNRKFTIQKLNTVYHFEINFQYKY